MNVAVLLYMRGRCLHKIKNDDPWALGLTSGGGSLCFVFKVDAVRYKSQGVHFKDINVLVGRYSFFPRILYKFLLHIPLSCVTRISCPLFNGLIRENGKRQTTSLFKVFFLWYRIASSKHSRSPAGFGNVNDINCVSKKNPFCSYVPFGRPLSCSFWMM